MTTYTTVEFNPKWTTKTIPDIVGLYEQLLADNRSISSHLADKRSSTLLMFNADEKVLTIARLPSAKLGFATIETSATQYFVCPGRVIERYLGAEGTRTRTYRPYRTQDGTVWVETITANPGLQIRLHASSSLMPASYESLKQQIFGSTCDQVQNRTLYGRKVPDAMRRFEKALLRWCPKVGEVSVEHQQLYFAEGPHIDVITTGNAWRSRWEEWDAQGVPDSLLAFFDACTAPDSTPFSELYAGAC